MLYTVVFLVFVAIAVIVVLTTSGPNVDDQGILENEGEGSVDVDNYPSDAFNIPWTGTRANETTDDCIICHEGAGILEVTTMDWKTSKHAQNNVSCIDCHEADSSDPDAQSHNGYYITHVVSPADCAECHQDEADEFEASLHSFGALYYEYLFSKEKLPYIESQLEGGYLVTEGEDMNHAATLRGCQACHGTNMTGKSTDNFTVWPNNGIGRVNPDGSRGSCSACHTRHTFSIAEARHPETCGQCHMGPDHPQIEMYMESKHGNIYSAEGDSWNWSKKNWSAGVDYRAPTCAGCHMSGIPGNDEVNTTHDVSSRLSWELENAISKRTDNTANSLGFSISDGTTWEKKQERMKAVCGQCHSKTWVDNYYEQADLAVELYNEQYNETKAIVDELYAEGLLTTTAFDEPIEFEIYEMWHHEGRRARMGAFMQAPDYVQWHGFYDLLHDKVEIEHMAEEIRSLHVEDDDEFTMLFLAANGPERKIYLKWSVSDPSEVVEYEIFWDTSLITDTSSLTPQSTTTNDFFVAENLTPDTIYYFAIVAVNSSGGETGIAFSSAMPLAAAEPDVDDEEDEDEDGENEQLLLLAGLVIILLLIVILMQMMKRGGSGKTGEPEGEVEPENTKEKTAGDSLPEESNDDVEDQP
jgi:hypothetical protein